MLKLIRTGIALLICFIFIVGSMKGQGKPEFTLKAHVKDMPDNTPVYLVVKKDTVGKAISKKGEFEFNGNVPGSANFYFLHTALNGQVVRSNALWLENGKLILEGNMDDFSELKLVGSNSQAEYEATRKIEADYKNSDSNIVIKLKEFVNTHPRSLFVPYLLINMINDYGGEQLEATYNNLSVISKESFYGKQLGNVINRRVKYKNFFENGPVGTIIPDFKFTTINGEVESLHNVISKNKFTLLDYWASWCKPCRAGVPEMKRIYEDFKGKGLGIVGVSIDKRESDWIKAVKEDQTSWMHCLDNINNSSKEIFEMMAIPGYILVDNKGRIVSADYINKDFMSRKEGGAGKGMLSDLYGTISGVIKE